MSIKAIHTLKSKLGMSDPDYRTLLQRVADVQSSKQLTEAQDRDVMAELNKIASNQPEAPKTAEERKIWALWLGSDDEPGLSRYLPEEKRTAAYLAGIVGRHGKIYWTGNKVRFNRLSASEAYKAIEGLKDRIRQEQDKLQEVPF